MAKSDLIQKQLIDILSTNGGNALKRAYFRVALYRGDKKASMANLLQRVGLPALVWNNVVIYRAIEKTGVPNVDTQLQAEYERFRMLLLNFTPEECEVLRLLGTTEHEAAKIAMWK